MRGRMARICIITVCVCAWLPGPSRADALRSVAVGDATLWLDDESLARLGLTIEPLDGAAYFDEGPTALSLTLGEASTVSLRHVDGVSALASLDIHCVGGISLLVDGQWHDLTNLSIGDARPTGRAEHYAGQLEDDLRSRSFELRDDGPGGPASLTLAEPNVQLNDGAGTLVLKSDEVSLSRSWAGRLGIPAAAGRRIGSLTIRLRFETQTTDEAFPVLSTNDASGTISGVIGPDIIVSGVSGINYYGRETGIAAFSVGTTSCNVGDQRANWIASTNQHPVIAQHMYRLKDNRFEQIGMSWVKHGFASVNASACGLQCVNPNTSAALGVGCSDPYQAGLNGAQNSLGARFWIDPFTGDFPFPASRPPYLDTAQIPRRLQVHVEDIDPTLNVGARYFAEGQYVAADEALAGNGANSLSYRQFRFLDPETCPFNNILGPDDFCPTTGADGDTQREQAAIRAWQDSDPSVVETDALVPGEGLMILAMKASNANNGFWRYEYAIQNVNSDRAAGAFTVPLPDGVVVQNVGFHDVDYHTGEPFDLTDWSSEVTPGAIRWFTPTYAVDPNANALRWGTLYNFRFEANVVPDATLVTIGLFKPGAPTEYQVRTTGPALGAVDCNDNGQPDACDIDCSALGCVEPCGGSDDCNGNDLPDECEPDCNANGITDECDMADCASGDLACADCNLNMVPDECEEDCDGDGIPDVCDVAEDCDGDGIEDCLDECPCTNDVNACVCPPTGCCYWDFDPTNCYDPNFPRAACLSQGGTPECIEAPCRAGCVIGDADLDGDLDLSDTMSLMQCYSGADSDVGFVPPAAECLLRFDFDDDGDVDRTDYKTFRESLGGP